MDVNARYESWIFFFFGRELQLIYRYYKYYSGRIHNGDSLMVGVSYISMCDKFSFLSVNRPI